MSMRAEDRHKNNNRPSRGLGLAAAVLGVRIIGFHCLRSKKENPSGEGSTTGWSCEPLHTLFNESNTSMGNNSSTSLEDSYTTIAETTTTDTVVDSESDTDTTDSNDTYISSPSLEGSSSFSGDGDSEWDVTNSSLYVPSGEYRVVPPTIRAQFSPRPSECRRRRRTSEEEHRDILHAQAFRERSWSLEECSICFEIMLKDQHLTSLPCSHNFHSACLSPWLAKQQTCPNCRKAAE